MVIGIKSQDFVISDSEDSTVTYTAVSSPFEARHHPDNFPGPESQSRAPTPTKVGFLIPAAVSPTVDSPGYIPESDLEEDDDEDPKEDPADYPTDRDDKEEEEEPSGDEADDEYEEKDDEEDEEEHPALADSVPPPPVHRTTARISIPAQAPVPFLYEEEVERFLAIPTPPPSPLTPLSSPLPQIPSPPLPVSPPLPISPLLLPVSPTYPLGFRAAMIWQRAESPSTSHSLTLLPPIILSHTRAPMAIMMVVAPSTYTLAPPLGTPPLLPIPLPTPSPPLLLPSIDHYGFVATLDAEIRRDPERDVGYGITNTWDEMLTRFMGLDEEHDARAVLIGRLNLLQRDRRSHAYTALLIEREARLSREAWGRSMAASNAARSEVMTLRTIVLGQHAKIADLQAADHARQAQLVETRRLVSTLQTQVIALQGQQEPAGGPAQHEVPKEAGSSS
ncbi:hypothetical protein Tco_1562162 [Tanacetum coccineum]